MTGLGIGHDTDKKLWARLHRSGSIQGGEGVKGTSMGIGHTSSLGLIRL